MAVAIENGLGGLAEEISGLDLFQPSLGPQIRVQVAVGGRREEIELWRLSVTLGVDDVLDGRHDVRVPQAMVGFEQSGRGRRRRRALAAKVRLLADRVDAAPQRLTLRRDGALEALQQQVALVQQEDLGGRDVGGQGRRRDLGQESRRRERRRRDRIDDIAHGRLGRNVVRLLNGRVLLQERLLALGQLDVEQRQSRSGHLHGRV